QLAYVRSWMSVPLISKGRLIGALTLECDQGPYVREEMELARAFADQAAAAIDNADLYQKAQELAAVQERQRLARDLHDSVTQDLYGVTMLAEAAARQLADGQVEPATDLLRELGQTALDALREMRLLIFELRPPVLEEVGLVGALQARLDAVEGRSGLETKLIVGAGLRLTSAVEEAFYRIALEALNNTLRHAHAHTIRIVLSQSDGTLSMVVADNGVGFHPDALPHGAGMGLRGMNERAESIGARIDVQRSADDWTLVVVSLPVDTTEQVEPEAAPA
ncbi:MAG: GAF domain-containing sensor histidine kinase, partial [Anaerolineae bacterium]|nr:GAF domain-containing sensor histidine kinase [Anaerolineae bacterium]